MNPILVEVTRGTSVESHHRGSYVVSDASGNIIASAGEIETPVFPRSAIKAFQCLPLIESGAADYFALSDEEIALCCSSHNGEAEHVRVATSLLKKAGLSEAHYECGAHWPTDRTAFNQLVLDHQKPRPIHNNCSGKHAGMMALAKHLGAEIANYVSPDHVVQKKVAETLVRFCDIDLSAAPMAIDGCSVPTWAYPLRNMALGFARLCYCEAGQRIISAARKHPHLIAGSDRFDTNIMKAIPRLFIKVGAEGVFCGSIAHVGWGFALKCDDGAFRAAEVAIAGALQALSVWTEDERRALHGFSRVTLKNWRGFEVGEVRFTM